MSTDGCWVQFYDGNNESGGTIRFDGPMNVADMNNYIFSTGEKAGDEPDSLVTGSRTWIQVFNDDDYQGTTAYFYPNQTISKLSDYGVGGKIDSFKLYDAQPASFPPPSTTNWANEIDGGPVSSLTINNIFRTALGASLMLIPKVGGALKTIVYGLWPDPRSNKDQAWACFQNYISQVVGTVFKQIIASGLSAKLTGLYNLTEIYINADPEQREGAFTSLRADLAVQEPFFISLSMPQTSLSFFLPFGSLMLLTLREEVLFYEDIYGTPPTPEKRAELVANLQSKIEQYQKAVADARSALLSQRAAMVTLLDTGSITQDRWIPIDSYSGWRGTEEVGGGSRDRAQYAANERIEEVTNALAYSLDLNLAPTQLWTWTNPDITEPMRAPWLVYQDGPYGDYQSSTAFSAMTDAQTAITGVVVKAGSLVDSIEVMIDGASTGTYGGSGGDRFVMNLAAGETIVRANGYASGLINELGFTSSLGQNFLAGSRNGTNGTTGAFTSQAPEGTVGGRLVGIRGYAVNGSGSNANVKVLTFCWYCELPIPTEPISDPASALSLIRR